MIKKTLVAAVIAVGGWLTYRWFQAERNEQDLWAEATDPVTPSSR